MNAKAWEVNPHLDELFLARVERMAPSSQKNTQPGQSAKTG